MSRSGARGDEIEPIADLLDTPYLEGCYTHFHSADRRDGSADTQLERFKAAVGRLARRPPLLHVANSAAALRDKAFALDMVRPGICLYGATPGAGLPTGKPVIAVRARVVSVRTVRQGEGVSYGASWTAPRDTTVATLGIGYADGVRRLLGREPEATVLLNGARCPVIGRVTMDLTMVDVGDGRAAVGDVATWWVRRTGWSTRWTSSPHGAARCSTSSWRGSVPGCRVSTIEARRDHRTRRTRHRAVSRPGCLRRRGGPHAGQRGAGGGRAAPAPSGGAGFGLAATDSGSDGWVRPRARARGQWGTDAIV